MLLPFAAGDLLEQVHRTSTQVEVEWTDAGVRVQARVPANVAGRLRKAGLAGSSEGDSLGTEEEAEEEEGDGWE